MWRWLGGATCAAPPGARWVASHAAQAPAPRMEEMTETTLEHCHTCVMAEPREDGCDINVTLVYSQMNCRFCRPSIMLAAWLFSIGR